MTELHTVVVSYQRLPLLRETLRSYRETVTLPHTLLVVDNASDPEVTAWLRREDVMVVALDVNRYPGYATNLGWAMAPTEARLLHRSDNDVRYLPGWCEEVVERFEDPLLGQLGLRTLAEEGPQAAVGGNCVVRRALWERGLRYSELAWSAAAPFEDAVLSHHVLAMGFRWARVERPCVEHIGLARRDDPYYQETFAVRGITFDEWGVE